MDFHRLTTPEKDKIIAKAWELYGDDMFVTPGVGLVFHQVGDGTIRVLFGAKDITDEIRLSIEKEEQQTCRHCESIPCLLNGIAKNLTDTSEVLHDEGLENKQVRYRLYQMSSRLLDGRLGKGNRKPLPLCCTLFIHNLVPAASDSDYVGFKEAGEE